MGLHKLRLGGLQERNASRPFLEVDHRFPAVDEALARVTSRCTQLRELDVGPRLSNFSLMIVASNCPNLQKLACPVLVCWPLASLRASLRPLVVAAAAWRSPACAW